MEVEENNTVQMNDNTELLNRLSALENQLKSIQEKEVEPVKAVNEPVDAKPQIDLFDEYCKEHYDRRKK